MVQMYQVCQLREPLYIGLQRNTLPFTHTHT